jgi:hypothetical protein
MSPPYEGGDLEGVGRVGCAHRLIPTAGIARPTYLDKLQEDAGDLCYAMNTS